MKAHSKNTTMKKSSYQKLKEENKKLRNEIHILVNDPMSHKAIELQVIYLRPAITPIMFSTRQKPPFIGNGIMDYMTTKTDE